MIANSVIEKKEKITIIGVPVDNVSLLDVERVIEKQVCSKGASKPLFLVTAYSEFFLEAKKNPLFAKALSQADFILPDGVSVIEAMEYLKLPKQFLPVLFFQGLLVGMHTLSGNHAARTSGIALVKKLLSAKRYRIFLLGGWNNVVEKLAKKYDCGFAQGPQNILHATEEESKKLVSAVNAYRPDILLVSFGRFKQEIWISQYKDKLAAKVIIGVGSAFDEILGEGKWAKQVPPVIDKIGLKWLWRVTIEPSHIKRIIHIPQFAWEVFIQKRNTSS